MDPIHPSFCTHADYKRWSVEEGRMNDEEAEEEKEGKQDGGKGWKDWRKRK